jgi:serine/threonine protein kinase
MNEPSLEQDPLDPLAESFVAQLRRGEHPSVSEYTAKHPDLAERIRKVFPALVVLEELGSVGGDGSNLSSGLVSSSAPVPRELGEYRILREVGRGGMGIVYEAVQQSLGRHVALKVLPLHALLKPVHVERFRRESRAAAQLHHTNIVPIFGVGEYQGIHYYAMQFIHGQGLDEVLQEVRRLRTGVREPNAAPRTLLAQGMLSGEFSSESVVSSPALNSKSTSDSSQTALRQCPEPASSSDLTSQPDFQYFRSVAQLGVQIAEALDYAHGQGILHRDIKPSNLLLDSGGRVWITDFGLAKAEESDELTCLGDIVGTLRYMAPERFQGKADPRSDVYGLGVTLYEMLTLNPAFEDSNRARLIERIGRDEPIRPRRVDSHVPRDLETIVLKAMTREPARRYATAGKLAEDLRSFLANRPIRARQVSHLEQVWRWCRRNPVVASLSAAILLLLAVLTAVALVNSAILSKALQAERVKLWESHRDRARALRMSRRPGQRIESMQSIAEALQLPLPSGHSLAELRTEAAAALALPDIEVVRELPVSFGRGILTIALDNDLTRYASFGEEGTVTVGRLSDDSVIAHWKETGHRIRNGDERPARFSRDGRYLSVWYGHPGRLVVHKFDGSEPTVCFSADDCSPEESAFTPDGTRLAYLMPDTRIALVELRSGQVRRLAPTSVEQRGLNIASDGRRFAVTVNRNGKYAVEIRELESGKILTSLPHPAFAVAHNGWHPGGWMIATTCTDRLIRLWDAESGKLLRTLEGHKSAGTWCAFDTTGRWLVSNDWDTVLRLWEVSSGRQLLSFPAGGYGLIRVNSDSLVPVMKFNDPTKVQLLRLHTSAVYRSFAVDMPRNEQGFSFGVHPEGGLFLIQGSDRTLVVADLANGREVANLPIANGQPLVWELSGALLTGGDGGLLRWPVRRTASEPEHYQFGPPQRLLSNPVGVPASWHASASGQTILVPDRKFGAVVVHRGPPERRVPLPAQREMRHFAISPDGRWAATGGHGVVDGVGARVWDTATGQMVKAIPLPPFCWVKFSPDGRWLLTTGGGCCLWATDTWSEGPKIGGAGGVFSPDGRLLAVDEALGALRLVDTETGAEVLRLEAPEQTRLRPLCFTPDGTRLIAVGTDTRALHVWDLQALRNGLAELGLDWAEGENHPTVGRGDRMPGLPLRVSVDLGDLSWAMPVTADQALGGNNQAWALVKYRKPPDPTRVVQIAQKVVELVPGPHQAFAAPGGHWNTLGVAHYRAGHWKESIEALNHSMTLSKGAAESADTFFLAMAHWRLGEREKARQLYDRAVQWMNKNAPSDDELRHFREEAAELLGAQ